MTDKEFINEIEKTLRNSIDDKTELPNCGDYEEFLIDQIEKLIVKIKEFKNN